MVDKATILFIYRSILRLHARHLPEKMRAIGDTYVRSEFKLHKNVTNEKQKTQFIQGWMNYLTTMKKTVDAQERSHSNDLVDQLGDSKAYSMTKFGSHLPPDVQLTDDQRNKIQQLKQEAFKLSNEPK